jgi:hypothetical protein
VVIALIFAVVAVDILVDERRHLRPLLGAVRPGPRPGERLSD